MFLKGDFDAEFMTFYNLLSMCSLFSLIPVLVMKVWIPSRLMKMDEDRWHQERVLRIQVRIRYGKKAGSGTIFQ